MKTILRLLLIGMVAVSLRADILRLRDGRMITGQFLGATRSEIWFKAETPGDALGAAAYPVEQVESLTFGPAPAQLKSAAKPARKTSVAASRSAKKSPDTSPQTQRCVDSDR